MKRLLSCLLLALTPMVWAVQAHAGAAKTPAELAKQLGIKVEDVRPSPIPGLYEVRHEHAFAYVSADGNYLLQGDMVNLKTGAEVTEQARRADRIDALNKLGDDKMITFAPKPPLRTRWVVTAFTDVDCPFCRKLQGDIAEYNAAGIAIRYAFYPRTGLNTESYKKAEAVWCAADRHQAFARAMQGKSIAMNTSCHNPVAEEYKLGRQLGLRGTPMLILPDGEKVDGYVPPKELAAHLAQPSPATARLMTEAD